MRNYWAATIWMWISDLSFALAFDFLITNYTSHDKVFYKASTVMTFLVKSKCAIISIALFCKKKLKFSYSMSPNPRFFNELFKKIPSLEIRSPATMSIKRIGIRRIKWPMGLKICILDLSLPRSQILKKCHFYYSEYLTS